MKERHVNTKQLLGRAWLQNRFIRALAALALRTENFLSGEFSVEKIHIESKFPQREFPNRHERICTN